MKTKEQSLAQLRAIVAEQGAILDRLSPMEAARRVWRPGQSLDDLAEEFAQTRCWLDPEEIERRDGRTYSGDDRWLPE